MQRDLRSAGGKLAGNSAAAVIAAILLAAAAPGQASASAPGAASACVPPLPKLGSQEVVVCATRPQEYRINPDVLAAKKAKKEALAGRPKPPETLKDNSCKVVGPAPCMDAPMISLLGAAATAAEMAGRVAKGQEVGSMFVTDPQLTEYQYYQLAKKQREEKEADAAAKAAAAAAKPAPDAPATAEPPAITRR
jgi:hypothetical protein